MCNNHGVAMLRRLRHMSPRTFVPHMFVGLLCLVFMPSARAVEDPVSHVIDRAAQRGNELIGQAERTGSAMASRLGNELQVAVQNAALAIGGEREKTLSDLSEKQRVLVL